MRLFCREFRDALRDAGVFEGRRGSVLAVGAFSTRGRTPERSCMTCLARRMTRRFLPSSSSFACLDGSVMGRNNRRRLVKRA